MPQSYLNGQLLGQLHLVTAAHLLMFKDWRRGRSNEGAMSIDGRA
jgi:hypothetical protein